MYKWKPGNVVLQAQNPLRRNFDEDFDGAWDVSIWAITTISGIGSVLLILLPWEKCMGLAALLTNDRYLNSCRFTRSDDALRAYRRARPLSPLLQCESEVSKRDSLDGVGDRVALGSRIDNKRAIGLQVGVGRMEAAFEFRDEAPLYFDSP